MPNTLTHYFSYVTYFMLRLVGEVLRERGLVSAGDLNKALLDQHGKRVPLG
jgi:hypothetical protein